MARLRGPAGTLAILNIATIHPMIQTQALLTYQYALLAHIPVPLLQKYVFLAGQAVLPDSFKDNRIKTVCYSA